VRSGVSENTHDPVSGETYGRMPAVLSDWQSLKILAYLWNPFSVKDERNSKEFAIDLLLSRCDNYQHKSARLV